MTSQSELFEFFLVTPLGLQDIAFLELNAKHPELCQEVQIIPGGISLHCQRQTGLSLNYSLKIPTKILVRIGTFKARAFPQFFEKIQKLPWRDWIWGLPEKVHASSKKSRLINTTRLSDTTIEGLKKYFRANTSGKDLKSPDLYLRAVEDQFVISLETSGGFLFKRSELLYRGKAGIRENIAYALLFILKNEFPQITKLYDPMCGSGTFLQEALHYHEKSPIKDEFQLIKNFPAPVKNSSPKQFLEISGSDLDEKVINELKPLMDTGIEIQVLDLFQLKKDLSETLVILNPPYGERIKISGSLTKFYQKILDHLFSLHPEGLGIVIPIKVDPKHLKTPPSYSLIKVIPFLNSGIKVQFLVFKKSTP